MILRFRLIAILAAWTICAAVSGQPVTIQHEPAPVSYYRMPDEPLDPDYSTYSADVEVMFRDISMTSLTPSELADRYLKLEGYRKVGTAGDVDISAEIGEFIIWGEYRKTTRHKVKGKVVYKYYLEVRYSQPVAVRVKTKGDGVVFNRYVLSGAETQSWISPSYYDLSDLESYWRIQRQSRLADLQKDRIEGGMKEIHDLINNHFGYRRISENVRFETIGKKTHPGYDRYFRQVEVIQSAFKKMDADKPLDQVGASVKPALDFYLQEAEALQSNSRDDKRLRHICLYNLALAYFWLEDFTQAEEYALKLQADDSKDKDARRLLEEIAQVRASLEKAGRKSRHQVVVGKV